MAKKRLTEFEMDCLWMSTRYCIGRRTISTCLHPSEIAKNCYERMNEDERLMLSKDINREIDSTLSMSGWYDAKFCFVNNKTMKPLSVLYSVLSDIGVSSILDIHRIKDIELSYNHNTKTLKHTAHMRRNGEAKDYDTRSLEGLSDLERWQNLSILLDKNEHKWCRLIDNSIAEYYETWTYRRNYDDGRLVFHKIKVLVEYPYSFEVRKIITDDKILEDNIKDIGTIEGKGPDQSRKKNEKK